MKEKKVGVEEGFYRECSKLLGVDSEYRDSKPTIERFDRQTGKMYMPMTKATRWGGREPGNGRFPGCGIIRMFSPTIIQVALNHPVSVSGTFSSTEEVLKVLKKAINDKKTKEDLP